MLASFGECCTLSAQNKVWRLSPSGFQQLLRILEFCQEYCNLTVLEILEIVWVLTAMLVHLKPTFRQHICLVHLRDDLHHNHPLFVLLQDGLVLEGTLVYPNAPAP